LDKLGKKNGANKKFIHNDFNKKNTLGKMPRINRNRQSVLFLENFDRHIMIAQHQSISFFVEKSTPQKYN